MDNTLKIVLGEEYKIKVEKIGDFKDSIFKELYKKAFEKTKEILESNGNTSDNDKSECNSKNNQSDYYNNIMAFVGERGTGKTSSMLSVSNVLKKEDGKEEKDKFVKSEFNLELSNKKRLSHYSFHSVGIIDPSMLSNNSNILEIVIAKMFQNFKTYLDDSGKGLIDEDKKRKLIKAFEEVFKNLKIINNKKDLFQEDALDALLAIAGTTDFKDHIFKLVKKYLEFMNSNCESNVLILEIDDIDLNTKYAYEMIEQIRKYFILPNVIIFMAVKIEQLSEIIEKQLAEEFKILIEKDQMHFDEIKNMSEKYLEKLIPLEKRLSLPSLSEISKNSVFSILAKNGEVRYSKQIDSGFREMIYRKTDMIFIDGHYILPNNLRGFIEFIMFLYNMNDIMKENSDGKYEKREEFKERKNIVNSNDFKKFRNFFFENWASQNLTREYKGVLNELYDRPFDTKNKYIVNKIEDLYSFLNKDDKYSERRGETDKKLTYTDLEKEYQNIVHLNNKGYNVSLGDLLFVLDRADKYKIDSIDKRFFYAIKVAYSFMLYETYATNIQNYKTLLGGYVYHHKIHKLMRDEMGKLSRDRRYMNFDKLKDFLESDEEKIKIFDNFIVKSTSFNNNVENFRQETEKYYEKTSLSTILSQPRNTRKIEFDILGFLFNDPSNDFYIGNIEVFENILRKNYKYDSGTFVDHFKHFITHFSTLKIDTGFNFTLEVKNNNILKMKLIIEKIDNYTVFNNIFKDLSKAKDSIINLITFKNYDSVQWSTISSNLDIIIKNIKKSTESESDEIVKELEEFKGKLKNDTKYITKETQKDTGKEKYDKKTIEKDLKEIVENHFKKIDEE